MNASSVAGRRCDGRIWILESIPICQRRRVRTTQTRGFTFIEKRKNNMAKKRKKKRGRKKIVLFVFEILVLIIVLAVLGLYNSTIGKIDFKNDLSASEAGINDEIGRASCRERV